jgi:hypothetical protein
LAGVLLLCERVTPVMEPGGREPEFGSCAAVGGVPVILLVVLNKGVFRSLRGMLRSRCDMCKLQYFSTLNPCTSFFWKCYAADVVLCCIRLCINLQIQALTPLNTHRILLIFLQIDSHDKSYAARVCSAHKRSQYLHKYCNPENLTQPDNETTTG